jgi:hypothetical protein
MSYESLLQLTHCALTQAKSGRQRILKVATQEESTVQYAENSECESSKSSHRTKRV